MPQTEQKNRWLIAASAVGIHISIGSVYAYSVMTHPVKEIFAVDGSTIKWAFKLAILFLGLTTATLGKWVEGRGPKKSGITAGVLYGLGMIVAGAGIYFNTLPLFFLGYGVIGGIGLGIGYIAPVSTLVKWFPDRKGLATGLAIMGFGFSALIFGPLMQKLFILTGVAPAFFLLGILFTALIVLSSLYLAPPAEEFIEEVAKRKEHGHKEAGTPEITSSGQSVRFWYLWGMMFINISCGIALISAASPLLQEVLGYTPLQAAAMVGVVGIFNGLGRLFWSSLSDLLGRANTFILFFSLQVIAFYILPRTGYEWLFLGALFMVISMYGGGFAILPAFVGDLFGTKNMGVINGRILSAWALAGVVGPTVYDMLKERSGSLEFTLTAFAACFIIALLLSLLMKKNLLKVNTQTPRSGVKGLKVSAG